MAILKKFKRLSAILLAVVMVIGSLPLHASGGVSLTNDDFTAGSGGAQTYVTTDNSVDFIDGEDVIPPDRIGEIPTVATTDGEFGIRAISSELLDTEVHDFLPKYKTTNNALDLHDGNKYFRITNHRGDKFAEGKMGEVATYDNPVVLDGKQLYQLEFVNELTQDVRLELREDDGGVAGEYIGLIAFGRATGQWGEFVPGDEPDNLWHFRDLSDPTKENHETCDKSTIHHDGNVLHWDGQYYNSDAKEFILPGHENGGTPVMGSEYKYFIRFQPTDEENYGFTTDIPLVVSYNELDWVETFQYREYKHENYVEKPNAEVEDPVYAVSGNFMWDYTDISVYGSQPLDFTRHYNAQDDRDGALGFGWRHSYMYDIEKTDLFAVLTLPDGYEVTYQIMGDGSYVGPSGIDFYLENYNGGYRLVGPDLTEYIFNTDGNLITITDVKGKRTDITRNGAEISSIANQTGTLAFSYSSGKISGVTDQTGRGVSYTYANGDLVSFRNADNDTIDYTYENHHIAEISDFNGNTYLRNKYDDIGRVIEQYMADRGTTHFSYDVFGSTSTVTFPKGKLC